MRPNGLRSFLIIGMLTAVMTAGAMTATADSRADHIRAVPGNAAESDVFQHSLSSTPFTETTKAEARRVVITEVQQGVRMPGKVAECYQAQGGNCTISQSVAIQATVSSSVGVTFAVINAQLGGSYSETLTTQISCAKDLGMRQYLRAYPSGDFVFFEADGSKETAFLPTGIQCQVEA